MLLTEVGGPSPLREAPFPTQVDLGCTRLTEHEPESEQSYLTVVAHRQWRFLSPVCQVLSVSDMCADIHSIINPDCP